MGKAQGERLGGESAVERTFVLIKPDATKRRLIGEIISRFERVGLEVEAIKMVNANSRIVEEHYPDDEGWLKSVGNKAIQMYKRYNLNLVEALGTDDSLEVR